VAALARELGAVTAETVALASGPSRSASTHVYDHPLGLSGSTELN